MKITAAFFNSNNRKILKIPKIPEISQISNISKRKDNDIDFNKIIVIVFSLFVAIIFAKIKISNKILNFATNFRQAEDIDFSINDVASLYNIFNKKNYVMNNDKNDKVNEDEKYENMSEYEILDAIANEAISKEVFASIKPTVEITENSKNIQRITINSMKILNYSSVRDIDYAALFDKNINLAKKNDKILLYNTHTSETYTNSEKYQFDYTGTARTTNGNFNMLHIAKTLNYNLKDKGFDSIQNTTPHDYGTYTSAYSKSRITVKEALENMGGAGISIDVHRDAAGDLSFRPSINIKGVQVAQLMFVMGVGNDTTKNPYYEDNIALALRIQNLADKIYPGLFRPMYIRNSVYNQDLNKYSLLVEVGATGNTIEEAMLATRCLSNLLNIIYKD